MASHEHLRMNLLGSNVLTCNRGLRLLRGGRQYAVAAKEPAARRARGDSRPRSDRVRRRAKSADVGYSLGVVTSSGLAWLTTVMGYDSCHLSNH